MTSLDEYFYKRFDMHKGGLTVCGTRKKSLDGFRRQPDDTLSESKGFCLGPKEKSLDDGMLELKRRLALLQGIYVKMILFFLCKNDESKENINVATKDTKVVR